MFMVETGSRVELNHEHGLEVVVIATAVAMRVPPYPQPNPPEIPFLPYGALPFQDTRLRSTSSL